MPQSHINFGSMVGNLLMRRPGLSRDVAMLLLNERMRQTIDRWTEWSGLRKNVVLAIPQAYTTGSITFATNSNKAIGTGTAWPVSDVVNTTIDDLISGNGAIWATPASMDGINLDTVLYVDAAGPDPEVLPVMDILGPRVLLNFKKAHAAGATATASSLNGLQIRPNGYNNPVYTCICVTSDTTLTMDQPWGQIAVSQIGYQMILMYATIDPHLKYIIDASDPFQQIALRLQVPQKELNLSDPNRTATNSPVWISPRGQNVNGNFRYEIWPPAYNQYALNFFIQLQWPDMRVPTDYPPPGISPNMLIYGALSDAYITPCPRGADMKDPGYNPDASAKYAQMFEVAFAEALNADQAISQSMWTYDSTATGLASLGANWNVDHDYDSAIGNF